MAMRCAERTGTGLMLWEHEFYMVMEPRYGAYLYQALEFRVGSNLPLEEVEGSTTKQKKEVWVRGVAYDARMRLRCMLGNLIKGNSGRAICSTRPFRMGTVM
jgi:hypothetical protein